MLAPGGEFDQPSPMLDFAIRSLAAYPDFISSIQADSGLAIEFRKTTAVEIALTNTIGSLETRQARTILTRDQLRALVPLVRPDAIGAIHYTNEAIIDPAGSDDRAPSRVSCARRLHPGTIAASHPSPSPQAMSRFRSTPPRFAVLAAGAWSSSIAVTIDNQPHPLPRSFPVKGHLLGYRLPAGSLAATVRHDHTYILQRADGFTIAGSSTEDAGYDRTIDPEIVSEIAARAGALIPALARAKTRIRLDRLPPRLRRRRPAHRTLSIQPPLASLRPLSQRHLARPRHLRSGLPGNRG